MKPLRTDLSVFSKFNFENRPVGVKFLLSKPEGIEQLDKKLALCEMLKESYERKAPFYFTRENEDCFGKATLGMMDSDKPFGESGLVGYKWGIFQEPRANTLLYHRNYHFGKGVVNYVVISPIKQLAFEPDLLIFLARPEQSEILLRAVTYSTGEIYESKTGPVLGCSWLFVYPYLSGKVNYMNTNLSHGMKSRGALPDGMVLVSVPFQWIPTVARNLNEMEWVPQAYTMGRDRFLQERDRVIDEIVTEFRNINQ